MIEKRCKQAGGELLGKAGVHCPEAVTERCDSPENVDPAILGDKVAQLSEPRQYWLAVNQAFQLLEVWSPGVLRRLALVEVLQVPGDPHRCAFGVEPAPISLGLVLAPPVECRQTANQELPLAHWRAPGDVAHQSEGLGLVSSVQSFQRLPHEGGLLNLR